MFIPINGQQYYIPIDSGSNTPSCTTDCPSAWLVFWTLVGCCLLFGLLAWGTVALLERW